MLGVALGGLELRVPQHTGDLAKRNPRCRKKSGSGVPQIHGPGALEPSSLGGLIEGGSDRLDGLALELHHVAGLAFPDCPGKLRPESVGDRNHRPALGGHRLAGRVEIYPRPWQVHLIHREGQDGGGSLEGVESQKHEQPEMGLIAGREQLPALLGGQDRIPRRRLRQQLNEWRVDCPAAFFHEPERGPEHGQLPVDGAVGGGESLRPHLPAPVLYVEALAVEGELRDVLDGVGLGEGLQVVDAELSRVVA